MDKGNSDAVTSTASWLTANSSEMLIVIRAETSTTRLFSTYARKPDNSAVAGLAVETEYSDYKDHGEVLTDIKSPGHIVQKLAGRPVLDLQIKVWEANNPYLVFPVPGNVKTASTSR